MKKIGSSELVLNEGKSGTSLTADKISEQAFLQIKNQLTTKGQLDVVIVSDSMSPIIQIGQTVCVEKIKDFGMLKSFDILLFWDKDSLICHYLFKRNRVFKNRNEVVYVTKGIASSGKGIDFPIAQSQILGKVKVKIPWWVCLAEVFKSFR